MKKDGADLGLGQYADAITQDSNGKYVVADPAARREILALRNDPQVSALMAGAYTADSKDRLESSLGRSVSSGELYVAHFLGAGGATKLISAAEDTPNARADMLFPQAAAANRSIFYTSSGAPRTAAQVY
ncbi:MAG TPA: lytic transglycosylase domain-containing protein, partial [Parvibaculum sp.]|nr:lytic transglycosylase domain-containing protein [Parvibaculum sp.]